MPLKESTLQQQLERARVQLANVEKELDGTTLKRQPKWRRAHARVTQLESRLEGRASKIDPTGEGQSGSEEEQE